MISLKQHQKKFKYNKFYLANDFEPATKKKRKQEFVEKSTEIEFYESIDGDIAGIEIEERDSTTEPNPEQHEPDLEYFSDSSKDKIYQFSVNTESSQSSTEDEYSDQFCEEYSDESFEEAPEEDKVENDKRIMGQLTMKLFENESEYYLGKYVNLMSYYNYSLTQIY